MPMMEIVKGEKEKPLVLMTRPDGNPAEVPAKLVGAYLEQGFKMGYKEPEEVTKRRAAKKIEHDLVAENEALKEELEKYKTRGRPKKE